ncbi:hypothetical protein [Aureimonas ureilytica]|uniref:hypothetical protein n=1 Tax=Aureimonas ureilytica TaxID=401562 RepID=UPI000734529D|nr:hypothetical protein [Aureimonas ureilytica]
MRPVLVKAPTARPIEPADVIARAEVLSGASVVAIGALIDAATGQLSGWHGTLGRCLVDQTWSVELEPDQRGYYRLPFPDVSQLLAVKDEGGGDLAARVRLRSDALGWYVALLDGVGADALTIQFVAGFGGPVKRALNMKGYSFIDVSLSGSNIGNQFAGYDAGPSALRRVFRQYCDGVITNHAGNDRRSGITFENVGAAPGSLNDASGNGLRVLTSWHNSDLRATLRGPKRIVRTTLLPATTSTDGYATTANQTGKNDDAVWVSDYATSANGDQFKLADLNMRRGAYAALPYGGAGECDAGWDMYAASGHTADGKFAPNSTNDGTHQFVANIVAAANDLAPRLPALLGFAA